MNKRPVSYLQTDPRWAKKPYRVPGESSTIGDSGCGPTAAAMLIETLTGKTYTSEDACAWSVAHGYKALKAGTYYNYFAPQFAEFGSKCWQLSCITSVLGFLTVLWGWFGWLVIVWAVLMLADWLIGTLLANLPVVELPFTYSVLFGPLVIVWYIIGELGSLAEHAVTMGAPVPSWLIRILDMSRDAIDNVGETITGDEAGGDHKN